MVMFIDPPKSRSLKGNSSKFPHLKRMAPEGLVPVMKSSNFQSHPRKVILSRMTESELKTIEGFKIWNEHGSIEWEGQTNVLGLNIDEIVKIDKGQI